MSIKIEFLEIGVNVVDYKTGLPEKGIQKLNPPNDKNPNGGDYWRQLVFYKILLDSYQLKKWNMVSGEIDFLLKDEKNEDALQAYRKALEFEQGQYHLQ